MRLLIVSQYFYPEEFRINELVQNLIDRGHQVDVLTAVPNYPSGKFYKGYSIKKRIYTETANFKIIRVPIFPRGSGNGLMLVLNYISFIISATYYFRKLYRKEHYNIIIANQLSPVTSILPIFIGKRISTPVITWVLDIWPESFYTTFKRRIKFVDSLVYKLSKKVYESSETLLVTSPVFKKYLEENFKIKNEILFFPNWIESNFHNKNNVSIDFDLPQGFNIIFAGNIGEAQGLNTVLKSIELLKEEPINWVFVGDGRMKRWLCEQKKVLGLSKLILIDRKPQKMMKDLYLKSDCLLLSLKGGSFVSETIPGKLPGYISAGKPILGILDGDGKTLINENNLGIACSAGDYESLARNAQKMSKMNPQDLKIFEKNNLAFRGNFDRKSLFSKFEEILQNINNCN